MYRKLKINDPTHLNWVKSVIAIVWHFKKKASGRLTNFQFCESSNVFLYIAAHSEL